MIESFVSEFVVSITSGIIMITIVDLILPETDIKKYIIKVCGLILMILVFSPIVNAANKDNIMDLKDFNLEKENSILEKDEFYSRYYFDEYYDEQKNNN